METIWVALIALASAVLVKLLDLIFAASTKKTGAMAQLTQKVDDIGNKLDAHIKADQQAKAEQCRQRILRADDEIRHGVLHSKDFFDALLLDITSYSRYCQENPSFPNEVTLSAVANIKRIYEKCKQENSFL